MASVNSRPDDVATWYPLAVPLWDAMPDLEQDDLSQRFFAAIRAKQMREGQGANFDPAELLAIMEDPLLLVDFQRRFSTEVNDPDVRNLIRNMLNMWAEEMDDEARSSGRAAELIDRTSLGVSVSGTVAATGLLLVGTGGVGAVILLAGSLVGVAASGFTRMLFKGRADRREGDARKIRRLLAGL